MNAARRRSLARMLRDRDGVMIGLTGGQRRALIDSDHLTDKDRASLLSWAEPYARVRITATALADLYEVVGKIIGEHEANSAAVAYLAAGGNDQ